LKSWRETRNQKSYQNLPSKYCRDKLESFHYFHHLSESLKNIGKKLLNEQTQIFTNIYLSLEPEVNLLAWGSSFANAKRLEANCLCSSLTSRMAIVSTQLRCYLHLKGSPHLQSFYFPSLCREKNNIDAWRERFS